MFLFGGISGLGSLVIVMEASDKWKILVPKGDLKLEPPTCKSGISLSAVANCASLQLLNSITNSHQQ